ncbi:MAG: hypothetical protein O3A93_09820 [Chloroflexi bacterium]|nr:hypothetical protein [Chloroflexota bacterium]MDA1271539.1 hypothetical protein [Chloroflexota bacterium]
MATKICLLLGVILLMSAAVASPLRVGQASANGATRLIINDVEEGPYLFRVGILPGSPKVGNLHLSILIQPADGDAPIDDGQIIVMATGPEDGMTAGPVPASNSPLSPQVFSADISLTALGAWSMTLETTSKLGPATLVVPLQVTEAGGFNLLIVVVVFVIVVIVAALGWSQVQRNRRPT